MDLDELKNKIKVNNIPDRWYSIDDGLKPDACIIYRNHSIWEYFFLDEKGERHDLMFFNNELDAYDHIWKKLEYQQRIFKRFKK
ncbi:hypothetical protein [Mucilaginibacter jinjuensis]|uniref:Uncharacterized protein n=1 Tax=Mucilaginibacter jinjuensis TaxID=1176721 RepID=A0ABY7TDJ1_9SPHI|nr:hypothetical protein [Mucilaginibacter jinjuensis]WCT13692.1 hypothetical protein PQO05_07050 [Mucilaginibacter jinjuensis]